MKWWIHRVKNSMYVNTRIKILCDIFQVMLNMWIPQHYFDLPSLIHFQIVNESIQEDTISPLEIEASSSDLSLIMSTMLVELGVLRQEEDRLVFVDEELNTVELEGADNTKIVLQLVEEDEVNF